MEEIVVPKTLEEIKEENKLREEARLRVEDERREQKKLKYMLFFFDWPLDIQLKFLFRIFTCFGIAFLSYILFKSLSITIVISVILLIILIIIGFTYHSVLKNKLYQTIYLYIESVEPKSMLNLIPVLAEYNVVATYQLEESDKFERIEFSARSKNEYKVNRCYVCKMVENEVFSKILLPINNQQNS